MYLLIPCIIHRLIHRFIIVMSIKNERRKRFLNDLMERYLACPRNINGCPRLAASFLLLNFGIYASKFLCKFNIFFLYIRY